MVPVVLGVGEFVINFHNQHDYNRLDSFGIEDQVT